ncbi:MAG: 6-bladed beta-propeller [Longimicrobiales bacterium]
MKTHIISGPPACTLCVITVQAVAVIGDREGPGQVYQQSVIRRDARGNFLLISNTEPARVQIFDSVGRFVRSFGRKGLGPGEFQDARFVFFQGDTTRVFDVVARRLTILTAGGSAVSTLSLPVAPHGVVDVGAGRYVFAVLESSARNIGLPLHLYDSGSGRIIRSFGALSERVAPGAMMSRARQIGAAGKDAVWSAHVSTYMIEKWTTSGELVLQVDRRVSLVRALGAS